MPADARVYLRSLLVKCDCSRNYEKLGLINICAITVLLSVISGGCSRNDSFVGILGRTHSTPTGSAFTRFAVASREQSSLVFLGWFLLAQKRETQQDLKRLPGTVA